MAERMRELSDATHHSEQLDKVLEGQTAAHEELEGLLKQIPRGVSNELLKEDGLWAKIITLGNANGEK